VLVIVANAEQAAALARCRPGRDLQTVAVDELSGLDLNGIDVLVRAAGGCGSLQLRPTALDVPLHDARPLLVIDADDGHCPSLARLARQRRRAYRSLGWTPAGVAEWPAELEAYLSWHSYGADIAHRLEQVAGENRRGKSTFQAGRST